MTSISEPQGCPRCGKHEMFLVDQGRNVECRACSAVMSQRDLYEEGMYQYRKSLLEQQTKPKMQIDWEFVAAICIGLIALWVLW
jgi:hypothetical protein